MNQNNQTNHINHSSDSGAVFTLSEHTDTTTFYGVNNSHILLLKNLFPNIRIVARGHVIKIDGSKAEVD